MPLPKSYRTVSRNLGMVARLGLEFAFEEWMKFSSCSGLDPEPWYPEKGGDTSVARRICDRCYVKDECLEYALENNEDHGVWGGKSSRQRKKILREINGSPEGHSSGQRRKCGDCGLVTSPSSLGRHQTGTGHTGWIPAPPQPRTPEKRFKCGGCTLVTVRGPLAMHQRASGHTGRTEVAQPPA